jgi:hypothetical protein
MFRQRIHMHVTDLDGWNEVVSVNREINTIVEGMGLPTATLWTETFGIFNHLVAEIDYQSLAEFEDADRKMLASPEVSDLVKRLIAVCAADKGYTEMFETADVAT